jgi:hypothetical protein
MPLEKSYYRRSPFDFLVSDFYADVLPGRDLKVTAF